MERLHERAKRKRQLCGECRRAGHTHLSWMVGLTLAGTSCVCMSLVV